MIDKRTVLVLGAGASIPYGFPCGCKLVQKAFELKDNLVLMTSVAEAAATDWRNVAAFIIQLQRAATSSIDAFLGAR
jgi:hypothetical protein